MGEYTRKRQTGQDKGDVLDVVVGDAFSTQYPATWEYLTLQRHDDGEERETMSVLIVLDGMHLKAWLHDRENRRAAWVSARSWSGLWSAVEEALGGDCADWRPTKTGPGGPGRRKSS